MESEIVFRSSTSKMPFAHKEQRAEKSPLIAMIKGIIPPTGKRREKKNFSPRSDKKGISQKFRFLIRVCVRLTFIIDTVLHEMIWLLSTFFLQDF